jgi:hypothetical protein
MVGRRKDRIMKIEKIEEIKNYKIDGQLFDGFKISSQTEEILAIISNDQDCCEKFGYFATNDNINEFVGADIFGIDITSECLDKTRLEKEKLTKDWLDAGKVVFVDIQTNKGTLQLAVYNSHNGYYGHDIKIRSRNLIHEERI